MLPKAILCLLLVFYGTCGSCSAIPLPTTNTLQPRQDSACGFVGNPDLYGLGIRLGVYFQWISACLVHGLNLPGRDQLMETYIIFLFALAIAIIVTTAQSDPVYVVEVFLVMYIVFGGAYTVLITGYGKRNLFVEMLLGRMAERLRALAVVAILGAMSIYCSWFWLRGMYGDFLETPCGTYGFLFAKVSLFDPPVTRFFAFLSIFMAVAYITDPLVLFCIPVVKKLLSGLVTGEGAENPESNIAQWRALSRVWFYVAGIGVSAFTLIYAIVGIELTIYWNSIQGVYALNSVGQLIPFVIGAVGFLKVLLHMSPWGVDGNQEAQQANTSAESHQVDGQST